MTGAPDPGRYLAGGAPRAVMVPPKVARFLDNMVGDGRSRFRGVDDELYGVLLALHVAALEHREAEKGPSLPQTATFAERPLPQLGEPADLDCPVMSWPDVLDTVAVAELLGCSPRNVRYLAMNRLLPGARVGGSWTFARDVVEGYLVQRTNAR